MKKLFLLLTIFLSSYSAHAVEGTGIGVMLGSPSGVTARTGFDKQNSISYGAGWNIIDNKRFQVHADYLWTKPSFVNINETFFDLYFGLGLGVRTNSGRADGELVFGPRLPVGVSYEFTDPNLELFLQTALNVGLIPSSDIYFDAAIGARFYF